MEQVDNLNYKFTKVEAEDKIEVTITDAVMTNEAIRTDTYQIGETGDSIGKTKVGLDMNKVIGEVISKVMWGVLIDKIAEESIETITGMKDMTGAGTGLEKGHFLETLVAIEIGLQAVGGPGQDWEQVQIETE